jgi:adenylosuccinate synthase
MHEAWLVVDLGFGDQGKGTITDFLVRDRGAHTVLRFNGGAQAGHNVVAPDQRHHTFAQFGAGSFVDGVRTVLTRHVAVDPWAMCFERNHLARIGVRDVFARTLIVDACTVVTPFHGAANRIRERARGPQRHGSCGVGVGEAVSEARTLSRDEVLRVSDVGVAGEMRRKLSRTQERLRHALRDERAQLANDTNARDDLALLNDSAYVDVAIQQLAPFVSEAHTVDEAVVAEVLHAPGVVVFEGAQGVLLDEWRGFHPYTTWSTCTDENARRTLDDHRYEGAVRSLGVLRAYATRHGAGPFVTEDTALAERLVEPHNTAGPWQGPMRVGHFDAVATRYARAACERIDSLAITCLDRLASERTLQVATAYALEGARVRELPLGPRYDLAYQTRLTASLHGAVPVYERCPLAGDLAGLVGLIAREVGDVSLVSQGPMACDKAWLYRP